LQAPTLNSKRKLCSLKMTIHVNLTNGVNIQFNQESSFNTIIQQNLQKVEFLLLFLAFFFIILFSQEPNWHFQNQFTFFYLCFVSFFLPLHSHYQIHTFTTIKTASDISRCSFIFMLFLNTHQTKIKIYSKLLRELRYTNIFKEKLKGHNSFVWFTCEIDIHYHFLTAEGDISRSACKHEREVGSCAWNVPQTTGEFLFQLFPLILYAKNFLFYF
jgi:hypothetical protein